MQASNSRHKRFLSTSPVWGTTAVGIVTISEKDISIHVPRMGDDSKYDEKGA